MPIQISCSAPPFTAQKSRKLLIPVQVSVFGASGVSANCRLRISVTASSTLGALTIQGIPGQWDDVVAGQSVQSATSFDPNGVTNNFPAFPAFFDSSDPTAPNSYSGTYQIDVIDFSAAPGSAPIATLVFVLSGTASAATAVNVVFVLDHGSSMSTTDPSGSSRLTRLKATMSRGVALLRSSDTLGATSFANWNAAPITPVASAGASAAQQQAVIDFAGRLTIDESRPSRKWLQMGLDAGRALNATATVVMVTDGVNNNPSGQVITTPTLSTSALIVSEDAHSPPASASQIVSSNGHYAIAAPQALGEFAMEKLLTQVLIGLAGNVFIDDPEGSLKPGESQSYPLHVIDADRQIDLIIFSNDAAALKVEVLLGSRSRSDAEDCKYEHDDKNLRVIRDKGVLILRWSLPPLRDGDFPFSDPQVVVSRPLGPDDQSPPIRFNLLMVANTDLMLDAQATSTGTTVGSDLLFSAVLSESGQTWNFPHAQVIVRLTQPDGFQQTIQLQKVEHAPGRFQGSLRSFRTGTYTAHFIATGRPLSGKRTFRRECVRTVAVFPPGACCQREEPCGCNFGKI